MVAETPSQAGGARRIAIVSTERELYGGEIQAMVLAAELEARGHAVTLLARIDGAALEEAKGRGLRVRGFEVATSAGALSRLRRILREARSDVLHANDPRALSTAGVAGLGLPAGVRSVSRRVVYPIRSPWAYRRLADRVLCVSKAVRRVCRDAGLPPERLHVVPDAVEPERVSAGDGARARSELGIEPGTPLVLTVASLQPCKGHRVLLAAFLQVVASVPDAILVLAGDGPLREEITERASALPPGSVHLVGYRRDVADLLAAADLFVLPSLQEGLGSALVEAALAGVPAVASAAGGIPEILAGDEDGPAGWMAPPGDAPSLAAAIRHALADPDEAARRAERARRRARLRHTPAASADAALRAWGMAPPPTA